MKAQKTYKQIEIPNMNAKKSHGGTRSGAGRKPSGFQYKVIKTDTRLLKIIDVLRAELKANKLNESDLDALIDLVMKPNQQKAVTA
ncbi:MAG: hypothetical protein ACOYBT_10160 [Polynucleobacter sp.]